MTRLLLPFVLFATACSCPSGQDEPAQEPEASMATPPPPPPVPVERIRGDLTVDADGGLHIAVCGGGEPLKVLGSAMGELREALEALEHAQGDPSVPVEVIGATRDQPGGGGMISVESLEVALTPGSTMLCELDASYLYRATGTEPFWSLTVLDGMLRFEAMDLEAPIEIPGTAVRIPGVSAPAWKGAGDGRSLEVELVPERCYDGMSGASYPYLATVRLDDATLTGCALQGWPGGE
jgi:putative lipoprotein